MEETSLETGTVSLTPSLLPSHCGTSLLTLHSITLQLFAGKNVPPWELKTLFACTGALSMPSCGYQSAHISCVCRRALQQQRHMKGTHRVALQEWAGLEKTQLELIYSTVNKEKLNSHSCPWFSLKLSGFTPPALTPQRWALQKCPQNPANWSIFDRAYVASSSLWQRYNLGSVKKSISKLDISWSLISEGVLWEFKHVKL